MTDPEHQPDEGGGLTGATGSLTPAGSQEPFVPAERREVDDPQAESSAQDEEQEETEPEGA